MQFGVLTIRFKSIKYKEKELEVENPFKPMAAPVRETFFITLNNTPTKISLDEYLKEFARKFKNPYEIN